MPTAQHSTSEATVSDLKPCPFCGGSKVKATRDTFSYLPPHYHIVICKCGACGPNVATEESAIAAWNRRVPDPQAAARIEALERALRELLPLAINTDPGGCDGRQKGCLDCATIRAAQAALSGTTPPAPDAKE